MKNYIPAFVIGLLIAVVWGYFSDLPNDQVAWFIGRLILVPIATVAVWHIVAPATAVDG